jgi:hypothetical protein
MSNLIGNPAQIEESNTLRINNKNGETIFKIDNEGIIYYLKDGKLKSFENEKELSQIFVQVISGMTGLGFQNRDEIIQRIIKNYRNGKIDLILD